MGPWELTEDSNGCLWAGGDLKQGSWTGASYQWLGGFGKFCPRDTTAPSVPQNIVVTRNADGVKLAWEPASDSAAISYEVLIRNDRVIVTTPSTAYTDPDGLLPATYWVRAIDEEGNRSSTTGGVTVDAPDATAPSAEITAPADGANVFGQTLVTVSSTDDRAVAGVELEVDGQVVAADDAAPYELTWNASTEGAHALRAIATDSAGNRGLSSIVTVNVPPDTTSPAAPGALSTANITRNTADLSWPAASDDHAVAGYRIVRDGIVLPATVTGLTYTDTGLIPNSSYSWVVRAVDAAGNTSSDSPVAVATTLAEEPLLYEDGWPGIDGTPWGVAWTPSSSNGSATTQAEAGRLAFDDVANAYSRAQLTGVPVRTNSEVLLLPVE